MAADWINKKRIRKWQVDFCQTLPCSCVAYIPVSPLDIHVDGGMALKKPSTTLSLLWSGCLLCLCMSQTPQNHCSGRHSLHLSRQNTVKSLNLFIWYTFFNVHRYTIIWLMNIQPYNSRLVAEATQWLANSLRFQKASEVVWPCFLPTVGGFLLPNRPLLRILRTQAVFPSLNH